MGALRLSTLCGALLLGGCTAWFGDRASARDHGLSDLAAPTGDLAGADFASPAGADLAGTGSLSGSETTTSSPVQLTEEGTLDWIHWGRTVDRKATGMSQIKDYVTLPGTSAGPNNNSPVLYVWTDGAPAATGTSGSDLYATGVRGGFSFTVPADPTSRTLKVYIGVWSAIGTLDARLSDGSAPAYVDSSVGAGGKYRAVYTLIYHSAQPGQTITVTWSMKTDLGGGEIDLAAATLH